MPTEQEIDNEDDECMHFHMHCIYFLKPSGTGILCSDSLTDANLKTY